MDCPYRARVVPDDYEEWMKPRGVDSSTSAAVVDKFNSNNTNNNNGLCYVVLYTVRYYNIMCITESGK